MAEPVSFFQDNMMLVAIALLIVIGGIVIITMFRKRTLDDALTEYGDNALKLTIKWTIIVLVFFLVAGSLFSWMANGFKISGIDPFYVIEKLISIITDLI